MRRSTRQTSRKVTGRQQTSTTNQDDPFDGLDPQDQQFNGNQGLGVQQQWPNQGSNIGGNRPDRQNQWSNNGGNRPQEQNQWSNNNGNNGGNQPQEQNQWLNNNGNNGGNRPQEHNQWSNNNGNNGGNNFNNQGQDFQGNNGNNRPSNQNQSFNNQNQNQGQTSTASNNAVSDSQRLTCNNNCRDRVTNDFNPVCGNDNMTYQNRRFLECVKDCGIRKYILFIIT